MVSSNIGLINQKPCPENLKLRTPIEVEEKVIYLRKKYHFGPERIYLYLKRYLDIETSESSVYRILRRNGINRLPRNAKRRSPVIPAPTRSRVFCNGSPSLELIVLKPCILMSFSQIVLQRCNLNIL